MADVAGLLVPHGNHLHAANAIGIVVWYCRPRHHPNLHCPQFALPTGLRQDASVVLPPTLHYTYCVHNVAVLAEVYTLFCDELSAAVHFHHY